MNTDPSQYVWSHIVQYAPAIGGALVTPLILAAFPHVRRAIWRVARAALQVSTLPLRILLPPYRRKWPECCGTRMRVHDDGKNPARARLRCAKCGTWRYVKTARVREEAAADTPRPLGVTAAQIRRGCDTPDVITATTGAMRELGVTAEEAGEALFRLGEVPSGYLGQLLDIGLKPTVFPLPTIPLPPVTPLHEAKAIAKRQHEMDAVAYMKAGRAAEAISGETHGEILRRKRAATHDAQSGGLSDVDAYVYDNECERDISYAHLVHSWGMRQGGGIEITEKRHYSTRGTPLLDTRYGTGARALVFYPEGSGCCPSRVIEFDTVSATQGAYPNEHTVTIAGHVTRDRNPYIPA